MTRKSKPQPNQPSPAEEPVPITGDVSEEELLAATRHALIEEEEQSEQKAGVLKKVARRLKGKKTTRKPKPVAATEMPATTSPAPKETGSGDAEAEEILAALDQAGQGVESTAESEPPKPVAEAAPEKPRVVAPDADVPVLRNLALEGYEETPAPSPSKPSTPISKKFEGWADSIQYRTLVRMTIASMTAVVCLATVIISFFVLQVRPITIARPTPTPTKIVPTVPVPIPMQIRLPGGWAFVLSRGKIVDGKWQPTTAEWLEGTEICRWVSLPWTEQLEAVMRTFKVGDRIDLVMTNYDHWTYYVRSVSEAKAFELAGMDKNYPSLLLILTKADSDERLVILAAPR